MARTSETPCRHDYLKIKSSGEEENNTTNKFSSSKGLFLAFLSAVSYAICSVIVKQMKNIHVGQLSIYRFCGILIFILPETTWSRHSLLGPRESRLLMFLRGIVGSICIFFQYAAFRYLPIGEATAIIFSAPAFVTVIARIVLKEECALVQSITVLLSVSGIIIITRLPMISSLTAHQYTSENVFGILAALGGLFCSSIQYVMVRKLKTVHYSVIMFNFGWVGILNMIIVTSVFGNFSDHYCGNQQCFLILLAFFSYSAQNLLTMALHFDDAGPVSVVRCSSELILGFFSQTFIFGDIPDAFSITGAIIIASSLVLIGFKKWLTNSSLMSKKF